MIQVLPLRLAAMCPEVQKCFKSRIHGRAVLPDKLPQRKRTEMRGHSNIPKGHASGESELIDRIIETDRSIENQLAEIEGLLERGADATLELSQLRELRQSCERLKELLGQCEKMPADRAAASH